MSKKNETAGETAKSARAAGAAGYKTVEAHRAEIGIDTHVGYLVRVDMVASPSGNVKTYRVCGRQNNNLREDVVVSQGVDRIRDIGNDLFTSVDEALSHAFRMSASGHLCGDVTRRNNPLKPIRLIRLPTVICNEHFPQVIKVEVENRTSVLKVIAPAFNEEEVRHV